MKKSQKVLSLILSFALVFAALPMIVPTVTAQGKQPIDSYAKDWVAVTTSEQVRGTDAGFTVVSDGNADTTSVGFMKFDMPKDIDNFDKVNLVLITSSLKGLNAVGSITKVFNIAPSKYPNTTLHCDTENSMAVFGNEVGAKAAEKAYAYCGVTEADSIATIKQPTSDIYPTEFKIDITSIAKSAKQNGETELCFAFIMPEGYRYIIDKKNWSDLNVSRNSYVTCTYDVPDAAEPDGVLNIKRQGDNLLKDNICIKYPTTMYLDISETIQDVGYKFILDGNNTYYGNDSGEKAQYYKVLLTPAIWGAACPETKNRNFCDVAFTDYTVNVKNFNTSHTKTYDNNKNYVGKKGSGIYAWEQWDDKKPDGTIGYEDIVFYMMGSPKGVAGSTYTYSTKDCNANIARFSHWEGIEWKTKTTVNALTGAEFIQDGNGNPNASIEMTVHFYDKSALNDNIKLAEKLLKESEINNKYAVGNCETYLKECIAEAYKTLNTREVLQPEIDAKSTKVLEAANKLTYAADNSGLVSAVAKAEEIKNSADYEVKYSPEYRANLEASLQKASTSPLYIGVEYTINTNLTSTYDAAVKASKDQNEIDALTKSLNDTLNSGNNEEALNTYEISFADCNGNINPALTKVYKYGTPASKISVPLNNVPNHDDNMHYTYSWPLIEDVTCNKTYKEIKTGVPHTWGNAVVTKEPTSSTVKDGEYTLTCTESTCKATKIVNFAKADYTQIDKIKDELNKIKSNNPSLTQEFVKIIDEAIAKAEVVDRNLYEDVTYQDGDKTVTIPGGQSKIDSVTNELEGIKKNVEAGLNDGSAHNIDYTAFNEAYNKAQSIVNNPDLYNKSSVDNAKKAIDAADLLPKDLNATVENVVKVTTATQSLSDAFNNATKKADYSGLNEAIKKAEDILKEPERYPQNVVEKAKKDLENAKNIYDDYPADPKNQQIIDASKDELNNSIKELNTNKHYFVSFFDADNILLLGTGKFKANDKFGDVVGAPELPLGDDKVAHTAWLSSDGKIFKPTDVLANADFSVHASTESCSVGVKPDSSIKIDDVKDIITNIPDGTTVKDVINQLNVDGLIYEFRSYLGESLLNESFVGTGSTLVVKSKFTSEIINTKTFIIMGDVTGDGLINDDDYKRSVAVSLGSENYLEENGYFFTANDIFADGVIDVMDTFYIRRLIK